jgi:RHS repeat-associated protein
LLKVDQVGSTRIVTQANGAVCFDQDYFPYGQEVYTSTQSCPQSYKFTGYERDAETGLDYAFARYYNARLGRFMSGDPLAGDVGDPQSLNRYAYARNNPINFIDPTGLQCDPAGHDSRGVPILSCNWPPERNLTPPGPAWYVPPYEDVPRRDDLYGGAPASSKSYRRNQRPSPLRIVGAFLQLPQKALNTAVCAIMEPLITSAKQNRGALGIGLGGSVGAGLVFGIAIQGGVQVVADPGGNVGISVTGGGNPGFGVFGIGGVGGVQFTSSTANTIYDLGGLAHGGGASGAISGVGIGADVSRSTSAASLTLTVGVGVGGKGAAYSITGTAVPKVLSTSCAAN